MLKPKVQPRSRHKPFLFETMPVTINKRIFLLLATSLMAAAAIILVVQNHNEKSKQRAIKAFINQSTQLQLRPWELKHLLKMVKAFDKLATRNNISYFLWAGTLLGVYRNGTILAWDEDFDLAVEKRHMEVIQKKIGKMGPYVAQDFPDSNVFKIFSETRYLCDSGLKNWTWPYIDIWWVEPRDDINQVNLFGKSYSWDVFFPTRRIKFHGLSLPIPNDVGKTIVGYFKEAALRLCRTSSYDHRREVEWTGAKAEIDCALLEEPLNMRQPDEFRQEKDRLE